MPAFFLLDYLDSALLLFAICEINTAHRDTTLLSIRKLSTTICRTEIAFGSFEERMLFDL